MKKNTAFKSPQRTQLFLSAGPLLVLFLFRNTINFKAAFTVNKTGGQGILVERTRGHRVSRIYELTWKKGFHAAMKIQYAGNRGTLSHFLAKFGSLPAFNNGFCYSNAYVENWV